MSEQHVPPALISSALLGNRLAMGSVALVAYEYVITFEQEIRFIWSRRKTGASLLFLMIRYYALVTLVFIQAISYMPMSSPAQTAIQYAQYFGWAVFAGMRALAVSNMSWTLASIVFVLACGPFAVNMWNISTLGVVGYTIPVAGCIGGSQGTVFDAKIGVGLSRSCAIASDLLIIAITWWNAVRNGSLDAMRRDRPKMSLTRVMVLNGEALVLLNTLHLTLTLLSIVGLTEPVSEVTIFTDP
ncbi:hypothetical protein GY45DRAFT_1321921 [Cubamyces sp. BRFM 1775]|nr:hypothetical protein GY45DRAFT_1321921 [Cubamyces sp. BRFM 1775]